MAPAGTQGDGTDLSGLWRKAIADYKQSTGVDLGSMKEMSLQQVKDSAEKDLQKFKKHRHSGDTVDRIRTVFGNNLDIMGKCMTGMETVGAAAGAFPPALPAGLIFMAAGRLLSAFAGVKADFDKIEGFFGYSSRFFERLSLIENKGANQGPLKIAIVRVFSTQLTIFAIIQKKMKDSRFKLWLNAIWDMEDPELSARYGSMQKSIEELHETVDYASYAAIKDTQDATAGLSINVTQIDLNIKKFRSEHHEHVQRIYDLHLKTDATLMNVDAKMDLIYTMMKQQQTEKSRPDNQEKDKRKQQAKAGGKSDAGDKKRKAVVAIKTFFDSKTDVFPSWSHAFQANSSQQREMREASVSHTGEWLTDNQPFKEWTEGKNPLLWLHGPEGIGKSFLVPAISQSLTKREGHTFVATFSFKEDSADLQSVQNAFACIALQIAEHDAKYAELLAARLQDQDNATEVSTWKRFFITPFSGTSTTDDHVFLIFDGLDEALEPQRQVFLQFAEEIKEASRVHVLVTSQSNVTPSLDDLGPVKLEVTKDTMKKDIRLLIKQRLDSLSRLRKFSPSTKKYIRKRVAAQADGMLYVEHMMRRLSYIGREGAVRKDLENMPENLHDLYQLMLDECRHNRTKEQYEALKKLFAWLAFSKRSLNLAQASELAKLTVTDDDFDVEAETIGRSSRILEVSRLNEFDEETKDEAKDSDNEDEEDEQDPDGDYQQRSVTFQERSLRQYFKAISVEDESGKELRTPASAAQLTILTMCVDILMSSSVDVREEKPSELRSYAVNYWHEHFTELDPATASDKVAAQVLTCLKRVCSNENNVALLFEWMAYAMTTYPDRTEDRPKPWYDRVQPWAVKAGSIPDLDPGVKEWANTVASDPKGLLLSLAQGHLNNWFAHEDSFFIGEAYIFAKTTLKLCDRFVEVADDPQQEILTTADVFGPRERDTKALRAIGYVLFNAADSIADESRKREIQTLAIEYMDKSLFMAGEDNFEKGVTLLILLSLNSRRDEYQKAINCTDQALDNLTKAKANADPTKLKRIEDLYTPWYIHVEKGIFFTELKDTTAALEMYKEARILCKDGGFDGYYFDRIVRLLDENADPDGQRLMTELKSWTDKERETWLKWCVELRQGWFALGKMYRAAKLTGELDLVVGWISALEKVFQAKSYNLFNFKRYFADLYSEVLDEDDKAKELLREALEMHPKAHVNEEDDLNDSIAESRMKLAGIIFAQFRSCPDPDRKLALLEELKNLPGTQAEQKFNESHIGMLLANMLRILGPAKEYQKQMDLIFKTCIDGLEDDVSYNDSDSLRLLAKVLSSLDGLERDARITISSQFSIMDRNIYKKDESEASSEDGDASASGEEPDVSSKDTAEEEGKAATTVEETSVNANPDAADSKPAEAPSNENASDNHPEVENLDEDVVANYNIWCDGDCETVITSYTQPMYLCLICPNTDLCESCHSKRQAWNNGEGERPWNNFCGDNHHYIKAPMKGWKGIKDGVIRIDDEEFSVKEWIRGLKEERWPEAWKRYWTRQGGLKDIDIED